MEKHHLILFALVLMSPCSSTLAEIFSRKELRNKEADQRTVILGGHPIQSMRIDPSRVIQLSWRPRVFLYRGFLSDEECDHLISLGKNVENGRDGADTIRLPSNISWSKKDEVTARIEERISAWTFLPKENSQPLQILHFEHEERKRRYNYSLYLLTEPLMATVILYLSNVSQGGQILFPESETKSSQLKRSIWSDCTSSGNLRPLKGNAILFFSTYPNATPDKTSSHSRCPVEGEMWCATKLFYIKGVGGEKPRVQSEDSGNCTDEDENCPRWAVLGECERNPVFMVGSADYYGTCRKSCNSC